MTNLIPPSRYAETFFRFRSEILRLASISADQLSDAAFEFSTSSELFCADYQGPELPDPHAGFGVMLALRELEESPVPRAPDYRALTNDYLAWAWSHNDDAADFLQGKRLGASAQECFWEGMRAALSAAQAIEKAKALKELWYHLGSKKEGKAQWR